MWAVVETLNSNRREFLNGTLWQEASCDALTGDASTRQYFRLRAGERTAILMDASRDLESVEPFVRLSGHLRELGFSAPAILSGDEFRGLLLLEDFGDDLFSRLLEAGHDPHELHALAADVLVALHRNPRAVPPGLRAYDPEKMLDDIELFLQWRTPAISRQARAEFRTAWQEALPLAHRVPRSLLLRDFHVANLMWLPDRDGVRKAGLLDFQDAYQGPVTYDLVSLLEDARRDMPESVKEETIARYLAQFPALDRQLFDASMRILAAQRHTRVLAIFERLSRKEGKHDYKRRHSPRVERLLWQALRHPALAAARHWFDRHAR